MSFSKEYRRYFRIFHDYVGKAFFLFLGVTFLAALTEGLGVAMLLPLLKVVGIEDGAEADANALMRFLEWTGLPMELMAVLLLIGFIFLLKGVLQFLKGYVRAYLTRGLKRDLKKELLDKYREMDYQYFISKDVGYFINVVHAQANRFSASFGQFNMFTSEVFTAIAYILVALWISWKFTAVAVVAGLLFLAIFQFLSRRVKRLSMQVSEENAVTHKFLVQMIHAYKYLVATARYETLKEKLYRSIHRFTGDQFRIAVSNSIITGLKEPLVIFMLIGVILLQVKVLAQPIAPILVSLVLFNRSMGKMIGIQSKWQSFLTTVGGLEFVMEEKRNLAENTLERSEKVDFLGFREAIEFRDVHFSYKEGDERVIEGLDLWIPKDRTVALVGETGSGKSTVTDMITGLLRPDRGEVLVDGTPLRKIPEDEWRGLIGYVPQDTVVFDDSVANNISLWACDPEDPTCMEKVREAARKAHCESFIQELRNGYDTRIGDKGVRLSGGQRQRLAIARELFKEPEVLILDEATSALDTATEQEIQKSLDELHGNVTLVVIAHRLSTIRNADHIVVLDQGRVLEEGNYETLTADQEGRFKKMAELQSL